MPSDPPPEDDDGDEELNSDHPELPPRFEALLDELVWIRTQREVMGVDARPYTMGRFEVEGLLGDGGMGLVLRARDPELGRGVALKLVALEGQALRDAVMREASLLARLSHPNVVTVHETGRWGRDLFIVMELVEGRNARDWASRSPAPSWRQVLRIYADAGTGLADAHTRGILHGDVKPSNILVGDDGRVRVADFGVAELMRSHALEEPEAEEPRPRLGTVVYMAPERLEGRRGDARSDQFSLSVSLWEALFAVRPFAGETHEELLASMANDEPRRSDSGALPGIPKRLQKIVRRGLAHKPDDRYPDMDTFVRKLRDVPDRGSRRKIFLHGLLGGFLCAIFAVAAVGLYGYLDERGRTVGETLAESPAPEDPQAILELVADDEFDDAYRAWTTFHTEARITGAPTAPESLEIARALLRRAAELRDAQPELAMKAAQYAATLASAAVTQLRLHGQPFEDADALYDQAEALHDEVHDSLEGADGA